MQWKISLTQVICLQMGKTPKAKTPPSDFKVTIPKNPLINNQTIISKNESYQLPLAYQVVSEQAHSD